MSSFLLETRDLTIGYKSKFPILKDVNVSIPRGELISLTGHNGAGKTTLIRTLTGLLPPLSGQIVRDKKAKFSWVPQSKNLHLEYPLTLEQFLHLSESSMGLRYFQKGKFTSPEMELLERFGMIQMQDRLLRECSGGQLQKALILRALFSDHDLLILDEPVDALDQKSQELAFVEFHRYIQDQSKTVLIITHNHSYEWMSQFHRHFQVKEGSFSLHCHAGTIPHHHSEGDEH